MFNLFKRVRDDDWVVEQKKKAPEKQQVVEIPAPIRPEPSVTLDEKLEKDRKTAKIKVITACAAVVVAVLVPIMLVPAEAAEKKQLEEDKARVMVTMQDAQEATGEQPEEGKPLEDVYQETVADAQGVDGEVDEWASGGADAPDNAMLSQESTFENENIDAAAAGGAEAASSPEAAELPEGKVVESSGTAVEESTEGAVSSDDQLVVEGDVELEPVEQNTGAVGAMAAAGEEDGGDTLEEQVLKLKTRLMELGYMQKDELTGNYDPYTQLGVMFFQRDHGLTITGIADKDTMDAVLSDSAKSYLIKEGTEGEDVRQLQSDLLSLGLNVEVTGKFGGGTVNAVKAFQRARGAEETGEVDSLLRKVISDEAAITGNFIEDDTGQQSVVVANSMVEKLIQSAQEQLGKPYILGAKGPNAFDCSGLVYYCLNQAGYKIGYMTSGGWAGASQFETINGMSNLRRGDIICYRGHVGIYLGNDSMLDASSSEGKVRITNNISTKDYWINNFLYGKRVLK